MATDHDRIAHEGADAADLTHGLRLASIALVCAMVTATVVIGIGGVWLDRSAQAAQTSEAAVLR